MTMTNWYNKKEEEIIERLKNTLESESLQFIGKFTVVEDKDFGFFKDVRSISGVRKYYPTNEGEPDDFNNRPLEVWSKKSIFFNSGKSRINLEEGKWYKFYVVPAQSQLRLKNRNPFLLQTDLTRAVDISLFRGNELIDNIQRDSINTPESVKGKLTRSIEAISNEINTQPATFIFELIQNADDYPNEEKYVKMSFDIKSPYLVIKHNGSPFDVNNAVAICDINEGDKRNEVEKIGFKGIGFKSIFKDCNLAYLKSGEYSFRFDEIKWRNEGRKLFWQITPINTEVKDFQNILQPFNNVNLVIKPKEPKQLYNYKDTLLEHFKDERILLFLRNVKEIDFVLNDDSFSISNTGDKWMILKSKNILVEESIREELNRGIALNDKRIPLKYQSIEMTEIGFGFLVNENKVQIVDDATIYAYLPTKVNLGLGFLLNGNFIPDGSRTHLHQDLTWNDFLFQKAGELLLDKLIVLIEGDIDKQSVLNIIPNFGKLTDINDDEKIQFIEAFKKGFNKKITATQFIPTKSGSLETLSNILIDETGLFELLGDKFAQLTGISEKLIDNNAGEGIDKIKELINQHSVGVLYDVNRLKDDIKTKLQDWLKHPTNNFKFIEHLSSSETLKGLLKTEEIVLSNNGDLCKASDIYSEVPEEISFLSPKQVSKDIIFTIKDKEVKIDFKMYDSVQFFKDNILGKTETLNARFNNESNLLLFWKYIFKYWEVLEKEKEILNCLRNIEILCKTETTEQLSKCIISKSYLSAEFNFTSEIESTVRSIVTDARFISDKYISKSGDEPQWRKIFHQLGAIGDLQKAIGDLLPRLSSINEQQHYIITKQIFKYWKDNKEKETKLTKDQIELIRNNLKLECIDNVYRETYKSIISDHFQTNKIIGSVLTVVNLNNQISPGYSNSQISEWNTFFKEIGCISLDEKQQVLDVKISHIVNNQSDLDEEQHFSVLKCISDLHKQKKENGFIFDCENKLSQLKLLTSLNEWHLPSSIHLSNVYKPKLNLQNDESIGSSIRFLNEKYLPFEIDKSLLTEIGVNSNFSISKVESQLLSDLKELDYKEHIETDSKYIADRNGLLRNWSYKYTISSVTYLLNHFNLNYSNLLNNPNYYDYFIDFISKKKNFDFLTQKTDLSIWNNRRFPQNTFIYFVINFYDNFPTANETRDKPTNLYANKLSKYITDQSKIPQIDLSNIIITDDGLTLEEAIGIRQELSIKDILSLLSSESIILTEQEIKDLNLVKILKKSNLELGETKNVKLPNKLFQWKPLNELFFSNDSKIPIKPEQHIHENFLDIVNVFGIEELSEESLQLKTVPEYPSVKDDIHNFYKDKAKYIAFKIEQLKWEEVESNVIEHLSSFKFYEVEILSKVFPKEESIYEQNIDFYFDEKKMEVFYKGYWKSNKSLIEFLYNQLQSDKIENVWFENVINRWETEKIVETLVDMFGNVPSGWIAVTPNTSDDDFWKNLTVSDIKFIKDVIGGEYELNEKLDANTTAKIKTLLKIREDYPGLPISNQEYYLQVGDLKIIVRSAQNGLLFLDINHWERLAESNVHLSVYTNNEVKVYETQEALFNSIKEGNKLGIIKMPDGYELNDLNSVNSPEKEGVWRFVFIVNENTKAAQNYKEVMNLDDYNF